MSALGDARASSRVRAGLALAAPLALFAATYGRAGGDPPAERAWSVQLHLHGPFSEGEGSIDSHSYEATDVGCDVLWWSEHDFRLATYEHVSRFGFEGWQEPLDRNEPWTTRLRKYVGDTKGFAPIAMPESAGARLVEAPVREGERSLRLVARPGGASDSLPDAPLEPLRIGFGSERSLHRRSLATGVTLRLALFPDELPADARVLVDVRLSEHAPRAGLGLEPRRVRYEVSTSAGDAAARRGSTFVIPVRCEPGRWNELELALTADAVRGFPESPGEDNALYELELGLSSGARSLARVYVDDLRIEQALSGAPVLARQAELLGEVGELYPGLAQLQGIEISYDSRHLNVFCEDTPMPDYAALARDCPRDPERPELLDAAEFRRRVQDWVLAEVHARGGLVSYNHAFGVSYEGGSESRSNAERLEILLANRAEGADLLEVGYRERGGATLDDHLWLWDHAALAGLRLVGTGVSDSHGGPEGRWRGTPNNFVSWVYAPRPDKAALIEGLRAGRVFFGDLERFDGTLDLALDSGERMGATVRADRAEVEVELLATGTRAGQRVVVVESGRRAREYPVEGASFRRSHRLALPRGEPALVRIELHDESGAIALSNPIHFLVFDGTRAPIERAR